MKTILVLTDFSIRADHAAHYALKLAQKIKANLLVCNVFLTPSAEPMAAQVAWPMENYDDFEEGSINDVNELAGRLNKQLDKDLADGEFRPAIEEASRAGHVADTLNEIAAHHHIIMAVISVHEADGLSSFLLGNHAREIVEKAGFPILLIPYQSVFGDYKKIAFATDMSYSDIDVVHALSGFAKYLNSEILITHVNDEAAEDREDQERVKSFFKLVSSKINYPKIYYRAIQNKSVTEGLQWLSEHSDIDMLAVVHRKHGFFEGMFESSVCQKMADHLSKPILVFPFSKVQKPLPVF